MSPRGNCYIREPSIPHLCKSTSHLCLDSQIMPLYRIVAQATLMLGSRVRSSHTKARVSIACAFVLVTAGLIVIHSANASAPSASPLSPSMSPSSPNNTCLPTAWASGHWTPRARPRVSGVNDTEMTRPEEVFKYNGLQGCAADREFHWHLGADNSEQLSRFPSVTEWEWMPGDGCSFSDVRPIDAEALIRHLVEKGGWLLLGGASPALVSRLQFFARSVAAHDLRQIQLLHFAAFSGDALVIPLLVQTIPGPLFA
jgi:hypothetical protein